MSNEVNLTKEEVRSNNLVLSGGMNKDSSDGNKIVPIANAVVDTAAHDPANIAANSVTADPVVADPANIAVDPVSVDPVNIAVNPVAADSANIAVNPVVANPANIATNPVVTAPANIAASAIAADPANTAVNSAAADPANIAANAYTANSAVPAPDVSSSAGTQKEAAAPDRQSSQPGSGMNYYKEESDEESDEEFHFADEERPRRPLFRFRSSREEEESRDKLILSRIKDEDLMEYLALEQRRLEFLQQAKETKQKRLLTAFQLLISLAAIVAVTYLLKDNPTILISILYIVGIIAALNIWKNPHDRGKSKK